MTESHDSTFNTFVLPSSVVSKLDVARLVNEAEKIDNEMTTASIHAQIGAAGTPSPVLSEQFEGFLTQNNLTLGDSHERAELIKQLRAMKDAAPVIHMTFAVSADRESLGEIVRWLRTSIHPQAVIAVGVQPALVAGVYLRTQNHVHDLSLRAALKNSRGVLAKELGALRGAR